jgi:hypothetical protein
VRFILSRLISVLQLMPNTGTPKLNLTALLDDSSPICTVHLGLFDYDASREVALPR